MIIEESEISNDDPVFHLGQHHDDAQAQEVTVEDGLMNGVNCYHRKSHKGHDNESQRTAHQKKLAEEIQLLLILLGHQQSLLYDLQSVIELCLAKLKSILENIILLWDFVFLKVEVVYIGTVHINLAITGSFGHHLKIGIIAIINHLIKHRLIFSGAFKSISK